MCRLDMYGGGGGGGGGGGNSLHKPSDARTSPGEEVSSVLERK